MYKYLPGANGTITSLISSVATLMPVSSVLADVLAAALSGGHWTYLELRNGSSVEIVRVNSITGLTAAIVRAQDSTVATAFPAGSTLGPYSGYAAMVATIAQVGIAPDIEIAGTGAATVTEPESGEFVVNVPAVEIVGQEGGGVEVLGTFPNFSIALANPTGCCGPSSGGSSTISITGFGLAQVELLDPVTYSITVEEPNIVGFDGIEVAGTWPNLSISFAGSVGTVTSVGAGAGLVVTGSPAVNPVVGIAATGVVAGDYGGILINARGQITGVPATLDPISILDVAPDTGLSVSRLADSVTISGIQAEEGVLGVMAIADVDAPLDPANDFEAVTPELLANVLEDLQFTEMDGGQTYNGEADGDYVNIVPSATVTIDIPAGGFALVILSVTVKNNADDTDVPDYGLALFDTTPARLYANPIITQSQQMIHCIIEGPAIHTLAIVTTDITGYTVEANSIQAIVI